uniref:DZF domain-containing protein n=1 Tax=Xiphophorus couchianus TaxID=32473 RepID=A0A3B5LT64_9TELE
MAKHASVYPAPEELEAVQALVSIAEGALKKVSDWMDGLKDSPGKTGDTELELVLMCRPKPTKLLLYTVSANLPLQIQVQNRQRARPFKTRRTSP